MQPGTAGRRWYATSSRSSQKMHWTYKTALGMSSAIFCSLCSQSMLPHTHPLSFMCLLLDTPLLSLSRPQTTSTQHWLCLTLHPLFFPHTYVPFFPHNNLLYPRLLSLLTPRQQTALHKAAWYGYRTISVLLIEAGASLLIKDYHCYTPYQRSMQSGDEGLMKYLQGEGCGCVRWVCSVLPK